jgi:hypothetical protein
MPWQIVGRYTAPCSCDVGCPCILGELDGDRGWCSGIVALDIRSGNVDGVDVGGVKAVLVADWPRGFLAGDGKGRMYFDNAVSDEQVTGLEAVLGGQRGGVFEAIASLIPSILPTQRAAITIVHDGDDMRVTVDGVGEGVFTPLRGPTGEPTRVLHGAAAFREDTMLGKGTGTHFHDPDLRDWQSGGHSELAEFDWSG